MGFWKKLKEKAKSSTKSLAKTASEEIKTRYSHAPEYRKRRMQRNKMKAEEFKSKASLVKARASLARAQNAERAARQSSYNKSYGQASSDFKNSASGNKKKSSVLSSSEKTLIFGGPDKKKRKELLGF